MREAHPDEFPDHPAHKSLDQKWRHALDLQERHDTPRIILVDTLTVSDRLAEVHPESAAAARIAFDQG